jgi:hypothetical protein
MVIFCLYLTLAFENFRRMQSLRICFKRKRQNHRFDLAIFYVIRLERSEKTSPQAIINMFVSWFDDMELIGCSCHSGRRTFITSAA